MRRILILVALSLFAIQALAAPQRHEPGDRDLATSWVNRAPASTVLSREIEPLAEASTAYPIVLLETNYYTFLPGEPLQLRLTTNPNGYGSAVTMYLYRENRTTGERRFYNIASSGLMAAGEQADLFGTIGSPVPVFVPGLNDLVLFGGTETSELSFGVNGVLGGSITVPSGETGLYQWVIELRDAAGKRILARSNAMYSYVTESVNVSGQITSSTTWTADKRYILSDYVGVIAPAVLTIEPGTVIYGGDGRATLFIQRGAKIMADGTARRPIIFTSPQRTGERGATDWGSLVLLGSAPINVPGGEAVLEGLPSEAAYRYGGTNSDDSSGIVRYVRLEFGGFEIATAQEINGLTLAGIGRGTIVDYVQVLHNKDDAFEFFGGTVNASHLLGIAFYDDGLDFDFGYGGSIQFAAMIKRPEADEADSNILTESDNNASGGADEPVTNPNVYNVTAIRVASNVGFYGGRIRRNSRGHYGNIIVSGSKNAPIFIDGSAAQGNATSGLLVLDHSILHGSFETAAYPNTSGAPTRDYLFTTRKYNRNADPQLAIGTPTSLKTLLPDLTPLAGSPALDAGFVANPPDNGFLKAVPYQGAVGPGDNWVLSGWATFSDN